MSSAHLAPPGEVFVAGACLATLEDGERWVFAVHAQPFCEPRAENNLENQRFRTFVPKRRKIVALASVGLGPMPMPLSMLSPSRTDAVARLTGTITCH